MSKIIMHVDLNAFFVTCEQLHDPKLANIPIAVGGLGKRGIILSASYEARAAGVRAAMPTYKALQLYPGLHIKEPTKGLYRKYSKIFHNFIIQYTPIIEMASIDECYADISESLKPQDNVYNYLKGIQDKLLKDTGLKCSIGVGPTKFLAKMGSDYRKPMGITIIRKVDIPKILFPLPIKEMYGIGSKTYPKLIEQGINTIGDLYHAPSEAVKPILGKYYDVIIDRLKGLGSDIVSELEDDPKSIGNSSTFLNDTSDFEEIKALFIELAKEVSERTVKHKMLARTIQVTIRDTNFKTITRSKTYDRYFNDYETILSQALYIFEQNYHGQLIRLIGIAVSQLKPIEEAVEQLSLFTISEQEKKRSETKLLIDELNYKMKQKHFIIASSLSKPDDHHGNN